MLQTKITPLYERLSRDDELQGELNSISNHVAIDFDGDLHRVFLRSDFGGIAV